MTLLTNLSISTVLLTALILNVVLVRGAAAAVPGALLVARQAAGCIQNCPELVCNCNADARCSFTVQTCTKCARVECTQINPSNPKLSPGALAGACVGGLVAVGILGFLAYRYCLANRAVRTSMAATAAEKENDFGMLKSARASTHTVASISSTVRTRASNVIQIAYIPGVTNRSSPSTPSHLVPPVPPLPYADSPRTPNADIQFAADDLLRGSLYTVNDNRSSVATTIYGGNAVVSQPNIIRAGKAAVVTVKAGGSGSGSSVATSAAGSPNPASDTADSTPSVPPLPALFAAHAGPSARRGALSDLDAVPPSPAFSVGSTFFSRMNNRAGSASTHRSSPEPGAKAAAAAAARSSSQSRSAATTPTPLTSTPTPPTAAPVRVVPGRSLIVPDITSPSTVCESDDEADLMPGHRHASCSSAVSINASSKKKHPESQCSSCITAMDPCSPFSDANSVTIDSLAGEAASDTSAPSLPQPSASDKQLPMQSSGVEESRAVSPFDDSHAAR